MNLPWMPAVPATLQCCQPASQPAKGRVHIRQACIVPLLTSRVFQKVATEKKQSQHSWPLAGPGPRTTMAHEGSLGVWRRWRCGSWLLSGLSHKGFNSNVLFLLKGCFGHLKQPPFHFFPASSATWLQVQEDRRKHQISAAPKRHLPKVLCT